MLEQNLRGAKIVKAFAQEDAEIERFEAENSKWFRLAQQQVKVTTQHIPLLDFLASLSTVAIIWLGGRLVIEKNLTLGELVAFTTYIGQLISPVRRLGVIVPAVAMASAAGERIYTILDAKSEVVDAPHARKLPPIAGRVRFEGRVIFLFRWAQSPGPPRFCRGGRRGGRLAGRDRLRQIDHHQLDSPLL